MKCKKIFTLYSLGFVMLALISSCTQAKWEKIDSGVLVSLNKSTNTDAKLVQLQVMSDDIIRVVATPEKDFKSRESLIIVPEDDKVCDFEVIEKDDVG
ncbi:MAG: DUF4968 domain-containing protein, partial [Bacteroidales bacterium]|nr:DUF4968 domain-containing protein [Bacteroidales bacterium]